MWDPTSDSLDGVVAALFLGAVVAIGLAVAFTALIVRLSPRRASVTSVGMALSLVVTVPIIVVLIMRVSSGDLTGYDALWGVICVVTTVASGKWLFWPPSRRQQDDRPGLSASAKP